MPQPETATTTMRAVQFDRFGPPEVLRIVELPLPRIKRDEVLVRVRATCVHGADLAVRDGSFRWVLPVRPPSGVGNDFTGHVVERGPDARRLREGEAVWGVLPHFKVGSTAEYVAVPERLLTPAPRTVDLVEAAGLPSSGTTAVTALMEKARLRQGQRLLVRGASGGVGSIAVQLGRSLGAHVTALVGARNVEWVRGIGADEAVDYRSGAVDALGPFDVILDLAGTELTTFRKMLTPSGRYLPLAFDMNHLARSFLTIARGSLARSRRLVAFSNNPSTESLEQLTSLVESGAVRPVIDTVFPLEGIVEAHRRVEAGGLRGKCVIALRPDPDL